LAKGDKKVVDGLGPDGVGSVTGLNGLLSQFKQGTYTTCIYYDVSLVCFDQPFLGRANVARDKQ
jgi:hypothetical protein